MDKINNKKIIIIILGLVIVLGAGYFAFSYFKSNSTTGWLIYKSEISGFSVKYPKDFTVETMGLTDTDWKYNPEISSIYKEGIAISKSTNDIKFLISVYENPDNLSLRTWNNHYIARDSEKTIKDMDKDMEETTIKEMPALQFELKTENRIFARIFIKKNDLIFDIVYLVAPENPQNNDLNDKIFQQFLNTLQFE